MKSGTLIATLLLAALPLSASERLAEFGVWYVWMQSAGEGTFNAGDPAEPFDVSLSSDTGYGASAALFLGRRFSTELAVAQVKTSISVDARDRDAAFLPRSTTLYPVSGTLQYHFAPDAMIDPYVGVGAMYVLAGEVTGGREADTQVAELESGGVTYLVNGGISVELTEQLGLLLDAKWAPSADTLRATANDTAATPFDIEISPIIVSIGVTYRWGR